MPVLLPTWLFKPKAPVECLHGVVMGFWAPGASVIHTQAAAVMHTQADACILPPARGQVDLVMTWFGLQFSPLGTT